MKRKIAFIGIVGVPAKYGGFESLVDNLLDYIGVNFEITVFCQYSAYAKYDNFYKNARLVFLPINANGISSIFYDFLSLLMSFRNNDVICIFGISGAFFLPFIRIFFNGKIIINIDGIEWRRNKWGLFAKYFLKFSENIAVRFADVIVSDNLEIQKYIKLYYGKDSVFIPYGGDHAIVKKISKDVFFQYPFLKYKYAFKVCRIEPENNIDIILESFITNDSLQLVIIGNWNNNNYGINLRNKYSTYNNIFLIDPIYDQNVLNQIRSNCFIYIHGHSAGGTNPSLVEAMILKLPIIAFDCSFNRATTNNNCMYFKNSLDLINNLNNINYIKLKEISEKMHNYANQNYRWELIASKYQDLFDK